MTIGHKRNKRAKRKEKFINATYGKNFKKLNFDVESYKFSDLDLQKFARRLSRQDHDYLVLYLMGHPQSAIGEFFGVSRSKVSKRLGVIIRELTNRMN